MSRIPIKTASEMDAAREAGRLAALVLRSVADSVKPGVTTKELDDLAGDIMSLHNVESAFLGYMGFPAQCCISVNDTIIHGIPDSYRIREGDLVSLDVGVWFDGFAGDNALTVYAGDDEPSADELRLLAYTEAALHAGIKKCRAGTRLGDVSRAIELVAIKNKLSVVREFVGHGIGRSLHEEPQVPNFGAAGRGPRLTPGMVICIEPMFNLGSRAIKTLADGWSVVTRDGKPSAHFEHMVAITDGAPEILTPRPKMFE